jgi:hypothetical protein
MLLRLRNVGGSVVKRVKVMPRFGLQRMQVDNECFLTEGRPDEKSDGRLKQQQKQQAKNEVTKACRGGRGRRVFKEMKLFLKGARFSLHAPPPFRAFHLAVPPMHSAASALRTVLLPCLDSGSIDCAVLSLSCRLTRSHQHYCHLPCPPRSSCRQRRLCSATCVHVVQIRAAQDSCDLRLVLGYRSACRK